MHIQIFYVSVHGMVKREFIPLFAFAFLDTFFCIFMCCLQRVFETVQQVGTPRLKNTVA